MAATVMALMMLLHVASLAEGGGGKTDWEVVQVAVREGRLGEAVGRLEGMVRRGGVSGEALLLLGDLRATPGHVDHDFLRAFFSYEEAARLLSSSPHLSSLQARALLWAGITLRRSEKDHQRSIALIQQALQIHPAYLEAHHHIAVSLQLAGQLPLALNHLLFNLQHSVNATGRRKAADLARVADVFARIQDWSYVLAMLMDCFDHCEFPNPDKANLKLEMARMAHHAAVMRRNQEAESRMHALGLQLAGGSANWERVCRQFSVLNEQNWDTTRDQFGKSTEEWQQELRPIFDSRDPALPGPFQPDWSESCTTAVEQFDFPLTCHAQMQEALLEARRSFYQNPSKPFYNYAFDPFRCLWNPLISATDARWAAQVQSFRSTPRVPEQVFYFPRLSQNAPIHLGVFSADWSPVHPMRRLLAAFLREIAEIPLLQVTLFHRTAPDGAELQEASRLVQGRTVALDTFSTEEAAERIRLEKVHVFLDTTGKTHGGLAGIVSHRPAPVTFTWAGFPGTSGNPQVDYLVADRYTIPPDLRASVVTENVCYIPGAWIFTDHVQHYSDPQIFNPRYRTDADLKRQIREQYKIPLDAFVIANWNRPSKMDPFVLDAVIEVLNRVEGSVFVSVLHAHSHGFANKKNQLEHWKRRGMSLSRFITLPTLHHGQHIQVLAAVGDVVLDTAMYNGGITTVDALYAGVPVISSSVQGVKFMQRAGGAILRSVGLSKLIAADYGDMVNLAVQVAQNQTFRSWINQVLTAAREAPSKDQLLFQPRFGVRAMVECIRSAWHTYQDGGEKMDMFADEPWYDRSMRAKKLHVMEEKEKEL